MFDSQPEDIQDKFLFWKYWRKNQKIAFNILFFLFLISFIAFAISIWKGSDLTTYWAKQTELSGVKVVLDTFTQGIFNVPVEANNYIVTEKYNAVHKIISTPVNNILLFGYVIGILILLTISTTLTRVWYAIFTTMFIAVLACLKLEFLMLFGFTNQVGLGIALFLFLPLSFYFNNIRTEISLIRRFFIFCAVTVLFLVISYFFSKGTHPTHFLTHYGLSAFLFISFCFVIMVSHEIIIGFVNLTSNVMKSNRAFLIFILLSLFYLSILVLLFLKQPFYFLPKPFLIFAISSVVGIWGFKKQSESLTYIFSSTGFGVFAYIGLAIITFTTIIFSFVTDNDPLIDAFNNLIIFSHLGMGLLFFVYVLNNFGDLIKRGQNVYKVVYKPFKMATFNARIGGGIAIIIMFLFNQKLIMYKSFSGYYNALGDAYGLDKNDLIATDYYTSATSFFTEYNRKSNYALAEMAIKYGDLAKAVKFYQKAIKFNSTPYLYAALSDAQIQLSGFFPSLFVLQEGIKEFPESSYLHNNIALIYMRKSLVDNAVSHLKTAENNSPEKEVLQANQLACLIQSERYKDAFTLLKKGENKNYVSLRANTSALKNILADKDIIISKPSIPKDTILSREHFAEWFNFSLSQRIAKDTAWIKDIKVLTAKENNEIFAEDLNFTKACYEYYSKNKSLALNILNTLSTTSTIQEDYYSRILGLWFMQQGAYQRAIENFDKAIKEGDTLSYMNRIVCYAENGNYVQSLLYLNERKNPINISLENVFQALLEKNIYAAGKKLNDREKVFLIHFSRDTSLFQLSNSIENKNLKILAQLEIAEQYLKNSHAIKAKGILNAIKQNNERVDDAIIEKINYLNLRLNLIEKNYQQVLNDVDKIKIPLQKNSEKIYFKAVAYNGLGDKLNADKYFKEAVEQMPLNIEVITGAVHFYKSVKKDNENAYFIILKALQLNPYSIQIQKEYILQSADMYLFKYSESALNDLKSLTTPTDYQDFLSTYQQKKSLIEKQRENF